MGLFYIAKHEQHLLKSTVMRETTKTINSTILFSFCITLVSITLVFLATLHVQAQSTTAQGGNAFKISPVRTDVTLRPGETRNVPIYVENTESVPATLKPIQNDFIAGDEENGIPAIILNENEFAPTQSLKRFLSPLEVVTVQPGERKLVNVTITVPEDASAGGYYGALRFAPANADGSEVVNVSGSVASLILLTVPGNLVESIELTNYDIVQDGKLVTRLSSPDDVSVALRFENKGNVHVAPFGALVVTKDGVEVFNAKVNDIKPAGVVLPNSARKYDVPIQNLDNFGKYTFQLVVGYGTNGQTIESERVIWIIPTLYIILAIGGVVGLLVLITIIIIALRAYKKKILRSARRRR